MRGRIEGIDLLRGIAVALVMARHAWPDLFPGAGVVGVVMFFALSGHLITGVLLDEAGRSSGQGRGRVDLLGFYVRRAARLAPALVVLLVVWSVVTWLWDPVGGREDLGRSWLLALTWTANQPWWATSPDLFHLWTLAGEEQFYLLWPALLLLGVRRGRPGRAVALTGAVAALLTVLTVLWAWEAPDNAYVLPTSWAGCFLMGATGQVLHRRGVRGRVESVAARQLRLGVPVLLAGLLVAALLPVRGHTWTYLLLAPGVAVATAVLVLAWSAHREVSGTLQPLVALGRVSYAAYLWNYPLTLWAREVSWWGDAAGPVAAVLTVLAALASQRWVEAPVARWSAAWSAERRNPREKVTAC